MISPRNFLNKASLYFHTIRYLKPIQILGQLKFRIYKPKGDLSPAPVLRQSTKSWTLPVLGELQSFSHNKLQFLNIAHDISDPQIWHRKDIDKLWLYNLHYFDVLKSKTTSQWQKQLIDRWIKENPPPLGNGWEPYTLSLRIVNWIKWILAGNSSTKDILNSIAIQAAYLNKRLEIHILGNHLLANAKALIFAGLFFSGKKSNQWLKKGLRCFSKEIKKQIYDDGGHCELSPMYHSLILEDLLDVINICNTYNIPIPHSWIATSKKMFSWLKTMQHPDNNIAFFNDTALDIAPSFNALKEYATRLNILFEAQVHTQLKDSGFIRLANKHVLLITDIADVGVCYQPGHAHADTLSFELSIGLQRLFVNSGISTYNDCSERLRQRGTSAHNTLTINDTNSSEVWKSFRVARRAKVKNICFIKNENEASISASHDGYHHTYKIIHMRHWHMQQNKLDICDEVTGKGHCKISIYFHVHPDVSVIKSDQLIIFINKKSRIPFAQLSASHPIYIDDSTYHPEFNIAIPSKKLIIETLCHLPTQFKTTITWNS